MNDKEIKLKWILAHPVGEVLGTGGTLDHSANEGVETYLMTATRDERGWFGDEQDNPGLVALRKIRKAELLCASGTLGIREINFSSNADRGLGRAPLDKAGAKTVSRQRRVMPDVVATFAPDACQSAFGDLVVHFDGVDHHAMPWLDWAVTIITDVCEL